MWYQPVGHDGPFFQEEKRQLEEEEKKRAEGVEKQRKLDEENMLYKTPSQNFIMGDEDGKEGCTCHLKLDNLERGMV